MVHLLFTQKQAALVLYVLTLVQSASPGSLYGPFTVHPETSGPRAVRVNSSAHSPHREVCMVHPETSGSHAVQWRILMNYYKPRTKAYDILSPQEGLPEREAWGVVCITTGDDLWK